MIGRPVLSVLGRRDTYGFGRVRMPLMRASSAAIMVEMLCGSCPPILATTTLRAPRCCPGPPLSRG
jgi:hypothetical protein